MFQTSQNIGQIRFTNTTYTAGSNSNYYPFGEVLPGRSITPTGMFGYQGQERASNSTNNVGGSRWYNFNLMMYKEGYGTLEFDKLHTEEVFQKYIDAVQSAALKNYKKMEGIIRLIFPG